MEKIILASTSPRRHGLMQQIGLDFEIIPSEYEEDMTMDLGPKELAITLAQGKAQNVAKKLTEGIVIGADTFVVFNNKKIGKPKDEDDAERMLKEISGHPILIYSGLSLINAKTKEELTDCEVTEVLLKKMSELEIKKYIGTGEPMDKAGAFGVQGLGSVFIAKINGCYSNVMGLPLHSLMVNLTKFGIDLFSYDKWNKK